MLLQKMSSSRYIVKNGVNWPNPHARVENDLAFVATSQSNRDNATAAVLSKQKKAGRFSA